MVVNGTTDQVGKAIAEQMVADLHLIGYKAFDPAAHGSRCPVPVYPRTGEPKQVERRVLAVVPGLPGSVGLPERAAGLRHRPPEQRRQPQHRGVLQQEHPTRRSPRPRRTRSTNPSQADQPCGRPSTTRTTQQAAWVDLFNPKQIDFLSKNVHGYEWNPQWYILIDQLWLSK